MSNPLKWELHPAGFHATARTESYSYYVHKNLCDDKYYALAIQGSLPIETAADGSVFQAMKWCQDHCDRKLALPDLRDNQNVMSAVKG